MHILRMNYAMRKQLLTKGNWLLNKKYAKIIPNFVKYVKNDSNYEDVRQRAFRGIDMEKLNSEFKAWIDTLKLAGPEEDDAEDDAENGGKDASQGER